MINHRYQKIIVSEYLLKKHSFMKRFITNNFHLSFQHNIVSTNRVLYVFKVGFKIFFSFTLGAQNGSSSLKTSSSLKKSEKESYVTLFCVTLFNFLHVNTFSGSLHDWSRSFARTLLRFEIATAAYFNAVVFQNTQYFFRKL